MSSVHSQRDRTSSGQGRNVILGLSMGLVPVREKTRAVDPSKQPQLHSPQLHLPTPAPTCSAPAFLMQNLGRVWGRRQVTEEEELRGAPSSQRGEETDSVRRKYAQNPHSKTLIVLEYGTIIRPKGDEFSLAMDLQSGIWHRVGPLFLLNNYIQSFSKD